MVATFDPATTAVLLLDYQAGVLAQIADRAAVTAAAATIREAASAAGLLVVHVRVAFRPGHPEASPRNLMFHGVAAANLFLDRGPEAEWDASLAPGPDALVVTKHRVGAFAATELEQLLRARSVDTVVIGGVFTSGAVLSTVRDAADRDYRIVVVADACADPDEELHRMLAERVFPTQAELATTAELVAALALR